MVNAQILATGEYLPATRESNQLFERTGILTQYDMIGEPGKEVETNDAKIRELMGVRERRMATPEETTAFMGSQALKEALERAKKTPNDLEVILTSTVTQEQRYPATRIAELVGAENLKHAPYIGAACSGFATATMLANALIKTGSKLIAVVATEKMENIVDMTDANTPLYCGSGAGAILLSPIEDPERGIVDTYGKVMASNGRIDRIQDIRGKLRMEGRRVFPEAVRALTEGCEALMQRLRWSVEDLTTVVLHQSNKRMLDEVAERLGLASEQMPMTIEYLGNISSASSAVTLDSIFAQRITPGAKNLVMCVGSGYEVSGFAYVG